MTTIDTKVGNVSIGPAAGDTDWVLAIHALGDVNGVPTADEQAKLSTIRSRSNSARLTSVIDEVLAR